jgi:hypothetical protein
VAARQDNRADHGVLAPLQLDESNPGRAGADGGKGRLDDLALLRHPLARLGGDIPEGLSEDDAPRPRDGMAQETILAVLRLLGKQDVHADRQRAVLGDLVDQSGVIGARPGPLAIHLRQ